MQNKTKKLMEIIVFNNLIHYTLLFLDHPKNPYAGSWGKFLFENPLEHLLEHLLENPYTRTWEIRSFLENPYTRSWDNFLR